MTTVQSGDLADRPRGRRLRPSLVWYLLSACTITWSVAVLVWASAPDGAESLLLRLFMIGASFGWFCVMISYLTRVVVSRRFRMPELRPLLVPALVVAFTVGAWTADLPIAVRWLVSAHSFADAAQQVRDGADPRTLDGRRLGLYRIDGVDRSARGIYFRTGPRAGHCSLGSGFAEIAGTRPPDDSFHHLHGDWHWFCLTSAGASVVVPGRPIGGSR